MSERVPHSPEKIELPSAERRHAPEKVLRPDQKETIKPEEARGEVAEALKQRSKEAPAAEEKTKKARPHVVTAQQKKTAYRHTMTEMQESLSPASRTFSKFIHNPVVENVSEVASHTVARPTSVLFGSFCAFVTLTGVYLLAQRNGFALSGFEFIALFIAGWLFGALVDFLRHMITGR